MVSIFDYNENKLREWSKSQGFPSFRGSQLYQWIYDKSQLELQQMSNLDVSFKESIKEYFLLKTCNLLKQQISEDEGTIKLLLELADKETIEIVIMRYPDKQHAKIRNTLCISSQVGCLVGCPFCATGQSGLIRNLSTHEILEQLVVANDYLRNHFSSQESINNIVYMGMGEPFLNWENVQRSLEVINQDFGIGERRITISTSGVVPGIDALAEQEHQWVLAISLHGSNDLLRDELVPMNRKYPLKALIDSCRNYEVKRNKRITFEYIMIHNKNIQQQNVRELKTLLKGLKCHINGIPLNETENYNYVKPTKREIEFFKKEMIAAGFSISIREEKGQEIKGACGQLRIQREERT